MPKTIFCVCGTKAVKNGRTAQMFKGIDVYHAENLS